MRKAIALIGILAAIALPEVAIANGYSQTASGAKKFVFTGLPPNQSISISINLWPRDKSVVPNACGLTVIKPLANRTIVSIDSASEAGILSESLPMQSIPSCSGGQLSETRANNFRTSDGAVVLINRSGFVRIVENLTKTIKSNRCGIANLLTVRSFESELEKMDSRNTLLEADSFS